MAKLIGIQSIDYMSKNNNHVQGQRLHCTYESKNVEGVVAEQYFVSVNCDGYGDYKLGDELDFGYNRFGKIVSINKKSK